MPRNIDCRCRGPSPPKGFGRRWAILCAVLALAATAGGCQRGSTWKLTPVEGTISKDGRPLPGIEVVFLPEPDTSGPRSYGITDEAGHYRLRTDNGDDGAVAGKYRVVLRDAEAAIKQRFGRFSREAPREMVRPGEERLKTGAQAPRVPRSHGNFNVTPLRAEVGPERQTLNFDVP